MSTSASIENFAVDKNGHEVPIRYKASDLVNRAAPEGYVWERGNFMAEDLDFAMENCQVFHRSSYSGHYSEYDYYIAVPIRERL
jgi:hypothetical protein